MECHVAVGVGVKASARLSGRASAGSVSQWRKKHGLKTKPTPSPRRLPLEEKAKRAQEEAFLREQKAWANAARLVCWSRSPSVGRIIAMQKYYQQHEANKRRCAEYARKRYYEGKKSGVSQMRLAMRNAVARILRKGKCKKDGRIAKYLGCTIERARKHIEAQFERGMCWGNHGEWEIDHIIPLAAFDLTKAENRFKVSHYSNLRPLWKFVNRMKSDRILSDEEMQALRGECLWAA
jgi:hypothetical protein